MDFFRAHWKAKHGYECSVVESPLDHMRIVQHIDQRGAELLANATAAFFGTADTYVIERAHPLKLFLSDPVKYLATSKTKPPAPTTPEGARHATTSGNAAAVADGRLARKLDDDVDHE